MRSSKTVGLRFAFIGALCMGAAQVASQSIDNREVFVLASQIADDVELIREIMGRPYDDSPRLPASEVSQLELYLQAQTLFRKANQLAQDFRLAERESPQPAPARQITPADVRAVLAAAAEQIGCVKRALQIEQTLVPIRRQTRISPTGVFMTIIDVNRQLNLMLDEPIRASDLYPHVAVAASYAAGILANLAPEVEAPKLAASSEHRRPSDIYGRLLECLDIVSRVADNIPGLQVMSISSRRNIPDDIEPGHVYDLATILVADLAALAIELDADGVDIDLARPEWIFPTHVYELAELLRAQLEIIDARL